MERWDKYPYEFEYDFSSNSFTIIKRTYVGEALNDAGNRVHSYKTKLIFYGKSTKRIKYEETCNKNGFPVLGSVHTFEQSFNVKDEKDALKIVIGIIFFKSMDIIAMKESRP